MADDKKDDYDHFLHLHSIQLTLSGVPEKLWPALQRKLENEVFDAGNYFSMLCQIDDDERGSLENLDKSVTIDNGNVQTTPIVESEPPTKKSNSIPNSEESDDVSSVRKLTKDLAKRDGKEKWKILVSSENGVDMNDPDCVFLIDHAWTYAANEARKHLQTIPGLLQRMCALMDIDVEGTNLEEQIEIVLHRMWRFNQTYSVQNPDLDIEEKMPVWYIMDEFGSRIRHSDDPNVRLVPFYYVPQGISYSVMFPLKNMKTGDVVTRDYVEGTLYHRPDWRSVYLLPWFHSDYSNTPYNFVLPEDSFFTQGRNDERLVDSSVTVTRPAPAGRKLKVYSEYSKVRDHLKHPKFEIVDTKDNADVLWLHEHFKDYKSLIESNPNVLINQIPFESVLTVKDLLAAAVHLWYFKRTQNLGGGSNIIDPETLESRPSWLATTYNLRTELPQFVSYFQNREKRELDNHWIIKPWNLARGLDMTVSNDLEQIIRLISSGPKIACKYIENPVLFHRDDINGWVKFDMRFIVLLKSVKPLRLYIYDRFWLRFALKPFSMDTLDDYEKHFTVFNYLDSSKIKQMYSKDFVGQIQQQYPQYRWDDVRNRIYASFKELFEIACGDDPPRGLAAYPQCRSMYGIDAMLRWNVDDRGESTMQPVILEVNFMPDCARACDYYPDFMNTVFETLFLDEPGTHLPVTLI